MHVNQFEFSLLASQQTWGAEVGISTTHWVTAEEAMGRIRQGSVALCSTQCESEIIGFYFKSSRF